MTTADDLANSDSFSFERGTAKIHHEHTLINCRMQWFLTSQAFLIASYGYIHFSNAATKDSANQQYFEFLLIVFGLASCATTIGSIFAAFFAIRNWRSLMSKTDQQRSVSQLWIHFFGDLPPAITPPVISSLWVVLAVRQPKEAHQIDTLYFWIPILAIAIFAVAWFLIASAIFYRISDR